MSKREGEFRLRSQTSGPQRNHKEMKKMKQQILWLCVLGLSLLTDSQVEAGMSGSKMSKKSMSMMGSASKYSKSMMKKKSSSKQNVFHHPTSPTPTPAQQPSHYHWWYYPSMSMMGKKGKMGMMSYKGYAGGGAYSGSSKSMMGKSSWSYKGKGSSMSGKGTSHSMMSGKGKGKGKGSDIRMMGGKGKGKGKGKGATYQTHAPADLGAPSTASPSQNQTRAPSAPSALPTLAPAPAPTFTPTEAAIPSREELCEPDENGVHGVQEGTLELVEFAYALETVPGTTNAEVEQIIDDLEGEIAASVVRRLVPECNDEATARRLQQNSHHGAQRRLAEVLVGLSPKPDDTRLTDRECDKETGDNRCDLVRASLTIWYIETDDRRRLQEDILGDIEGAISGSMADGEYDALARDSDPNDPFDAVVSVEWVPLSDLELQRDFTVAPVGNDDDDDGLDLLWIIVIAGGGAALCCLIAAAFFFTRRASVGDEGDQPEKGDPVLFQI